MPQLMDDSDFRTNAGVVSLTDAMVTVRFELQNKDGYVIHRVDKLLPPFGHTQWRLDKGVTGGTLAAFIQSGPNDAMVVPYASVVNNVTGDPVNIESHMTPVGVGAQGASAAVVAGRVAGAFPPREPVAGAQVEHRSDR